MIDPTRAAAAAPVPQSPPSSPEAPAVEEPQRAAPVVRRDAVQISDQAQAMLAAEQAAGET